MPREREREGEGKSISGSGVDLGCTEREVDQGEARRRDGQKPPLRKNLSAKKVGSTIHLAGTSGLECQDPQGEGHDSEDAPVEFFLGSGHLSCYTSLTHTCCAAPTYARGSDTRQRNDLTSAGLLVWYRFWLPEALVSHMVGGGGGCPSSR